MIRAFLLFCLTTLCLPAVGHAARSEAVETRTLTAELVMAQQGVAPGLGVLSAGVHLSLAPGWKTYWRAPGEVGLPPSLSWDGSRNVSDITLSYPAPTRFTAFEIENFGYAGQVLFPLQVHLTDPGAPATLALEMTVLVCADVCIPETLSLTLDVPKGTGIDATDAALIADWSARVPLEGAQATGMTARAAIGDALVVEVTADTPFVAPDIFPEQGDYASFGKPDLRLSQDGRRLWASLPVLAAGEGPLQVTIVDGARSGTIEATLLATPPAAPDAPRLWPMVLIALLGGLILNVMPCVLPVLSIKLASALSAGGQSPARIRAGFLASAIGVLAFFWVLAGVVLGLRVAGLSFGWGVQFQNPIFLTLMVSILVLFAANLFGLFEISLGQGVQTELAKSESKGGWWGDFATGAFAAILATPCSAPFLGTAVTYALSHGPLQIIVIFTALGVGLAAPYLLVAARPNLVARLPKPGRWMVAIKGLMGVLLLGTALWLLAVLAGVGGLVLGVAVAVLAVVTLGALALRLPARAVAPLALALALAIPFLPPTPDSRDAGDWPAFSEAEIPALIAAGQAVFVDVTADWCLTCKANKTLVLDRGAVADTLSTITLRRADWTRPDPAIQAFLERNGRYGIPFNIVYGPAAPQGIVLPELLTSEAVLSAISAAGAVRQ